MSNEHGDEIKVRDRRTYAEDAQEASPGTQEASPGTQEASPGEAGSSEGAAAEQEAASREAYDEAVGECAEPGGEEQALPAVDFSTLVLSIAQGVLMNLGEVPDPDTGTSSVSLGMARHSIDLLGLLQDKTRGNLDRDEQQLIENLLYDLRMKYVTQCKAG